MFVIFCEIRKKHLKIPYCRIIVPGHHVYIHVHHDYPQISNVINPHSSFSVDLHIWNGTVCTTITGAYIIMFQKHPSLRQFTVGTSHQRTHRLSQIERVHIASQHKIINSPNSRVASKTLLDRLHPIRLVTSASFPRQIREFSSVYARFSSFRMSHSQSELDCTELVHDAIFSPGADIAKMQEELTTLLTGKHADGKWALTTDRMGIERSFKFKGFDRCWV